MSIPIRKSTLRSPHINAPAAESLSKQANQSAAALGHAGAATLGLAQAASVGDIVNINYYIKKKRNSMSIPIRKSTMRSPHINAPTAESLSKQAHQSAAASGHAKAAGTLGSRRSGSAGASVGDMAAAVAEAPARRR